MAAMGLKQLCNFMIDDGMGGKVFIERLVLKPNGLVVLESNWLKGNIFGADTIDAWAQVIGKRTYRFNNPLYRMENAVAALRYHLPQIPVSAKVVFVGDCTFPKGQPESALRLEEISGQNDDTDESVLNKNYMDGWNKLEGLAEGVSQNVYMGQDEEKYLNRYLLLILFLSVTVGWTVWRLITG